MKKGSGALVTWCQAVLSEPEYRNVHVENLTSCFSDGLVLCALVHKLEPTLFDYDSLRPQNAMKNCELALDMFSEHFDVPPLLDAEDVASGPDSRSIQLYLSYVIKIYKKRLGTKQFSSPQNIMASKKSSPAAMDPHMVSQFASSTPAIPSVKARGPVRRRIPEKPAEVVHRAPIQSFYSQPRLQKVEMVKEEEPEEKEAPRTPPPVIRLTGGDAVDVPGLQTELHRSKLEIAALKEEISELKEAAKKHSAPAPVVVSDKEARERIEDLEMQTEMLQMSLDDSRAMVLELENKQKSKKGSHVRRVSWAPAPAELAGALKAPASPTDDSPRTSRLRKKLREALHSVEGLNKELDVANRKARRAERQAHQLEVVEGDLKQLRKENERLKRQLAGNQ